LEEVYNFNNLKNELQSSNGKYNKLYYKLLYLAEQVKIQLSTKTSADIEFEIDDKDIYFTITRDEFEKIIKNDIVKTIDMIKKILISNSLRNDDIDFILMVGGSTYIPFVRKYIENVLQIKVLNDIDPTTAVAIGAAYYAGNKKKTILEKNIQKQSNKFKIKMAYEKSTQEESEYFAAKIEGETTNFFYKITRYDGGFDSGLKKLDNRISEDLPLIKDNYNFFKLSIYDSFNNVVQTENIEISQGKYRIMGQPLPDDISLEVDDYYQNKTKLELIFKKNTILPIKKTITKDINKTITMGSNDSIIINLLEGDSNSIPEANKTLGFIKISGKDIDRNILKGSDIDLTFEISESRDFTVSAYISMIDQEFKEIFNPKNRKVDVIDLLDDLENLSINIQKSLELTKENTDYVKLDILYELQTNIYELQNEANILTENDITDKRYQLEDKKRELAQKYFKSIKDEDANRIKKEYLDLKHEVERLVAQYGNYMEQEYFKQIVEKEKIYLNTNNTLKLEELLDEIKNFKYQMHWKDPEFIKGSFAWLVSEEFTFEDESRANILIGKGYKFFEQNNIEELSNTTRELIGLLKRGEKEKIENKIGFY